MKWTKVENYSAMSRYGAEVIYRAAVKKLAKGERFNLGLATGNTMLELYPALAAMFNQNRIDLSRLHTYNLDEYVIDGKPVPHSHPLSYYTYMHENLFRHIDPARGLTEAHIHFPDPLHPLDYDREIAAGGGLDLQLLGIGFNGHIAFNEPMDPKEISSADFAALPTHVLSLTPATIEQNTRITAHNDGSLVPRHAVSMGMEPILHAKELLLLACFPEQVKPLTEMKRMSAPSPALPASYLLIHSHSEIVYSAVEVRLD